MKIDKEEYEILDALKKDQLELAEPTAKELAVIKAAADKTINGKPGSQNA